MTISLDSGSQSTLIFQQSVINRNHKSDDELLVSADINYYKNQNNDNSSETYRLESTELVPLFHKPQGNPVMTRVTEGC